VQRYVENFTEQLRSANAKLLIANDNLSRIDESRLRLIRTVSHELANVLNTLTLTVSLITTGNDEAIRSEMLDICQRNIREMSELLSDLKDYSVLIAGAASVQIEEINVRVFGGELEASFHAMTQDAGVHLHLQIDPDLDVIRSDRRKIRQIITNLVTNAINYCGRDKPKKTVLLEFRSLDQGSWQIAVEDSGIGIPPEHLDSIFDEFKRISPSGDIKGAGLGLAITKRLVEDLKGTIEVVSEVGQGSRFVVTQTGESAPAVFPRYSLGPYQSRYGRFAHALKNSELTCGDSTIIARRCIRELTIRNGLLALGAICNLFSKFFSAKPMHARAFIA
jgi:signal transduction histidine kinase